MRSWTSGSSARSRTTSGSRDIPLSSSPCGNPSEGAVARATLASASFHHGGIAERSAGAEATTAANLASPKSHNARVAGPPSGEGGESE